MSSPFFLSYHCVQLKLSLEGLKTPSKVRFIMRQVSGGTLNKVVCLLLLQVCSDTECFDLLLEKERVFFSSAQCSPSLSFRWSLTKKKKKEVSSFIMAPFGIFPPSLSFTVWSSLLPLWFAAQSLPTPLTLTAAELGL